MRWLGLLRGLALLRGFAATLRALDVLRALGVTALRVDDFAAACRPVHFLVTAGRAAGRDAAFFLGMCASLMFERERLAQMRLRSVGKAQRAHQPRCAMLRWARFALPTPAKTRWTTRVN